MSAADAKAKLLAWGERTQHELASAVEQSRAALKSDVAEVTGKLKDDLYEVKEHVVGDLRRYAPLAAGAAAVAGFLVSRATGGRRGDDTPSEVVVRTEGGERYAVHGAGAAARGRRPLLVAILAGLLRRVLPIVVRFAARRLAAARAPIVD